MDPDVNKYLSPDINRNDSIVYNFQTASMIEVTSKLFHFTVKFLSFKRYVSGAFKGLGYFSRKIFLTVTSIKKTLLFCFPLCAQTNESKLIFLSKNIGRFFPPVRKI